MAELTVIFGGQEQGKHVLDKTRAVVGRDPSCEIAIDNLGISRQHCSFEDKGETFLLQDMGSSNGTYVNGRKITQHYLNDGDEVVIGKYTLKFRNEKQTPQPAAKRDAAVPDTMNTYVMDGSKIQEQLAKMREQTGDGQKSAAPGTGATAKEIAKAMDGGAAPGALQAQYGLVKNIMIVSLIANLVLAALLVLILAKVIPH